jgi:hypothetical protein
MTTLPTLTAAVALAGMHALLPAQSLDYTNGVTSLTFSVLQNDIRLTQLVNIRDGLMTPLAGTAPHFVMELEPDPSVPQWQPAHRIVLRSADFPLSDLLYYTFPPNTVRPGTPGGQLLILIFGPKVVTPPVGSGQAPFVTGVACVWRLFDGADHFDATAISGVIPLGASNYKVWRLDFPLLDVPRLAGGGQDALATGAFGGYLFGDPIQRIDLQWPNSGLADPDWQDVQPLAADPGAYSVPVLAYTDVPGQRTVYFSCDDQRGVLKHLRANARRPQDSMRLSGGFFPEGDVFQDPLLQPSFSMQVGLIRGDWRDAATKYRTQMSSYSWYRGPVGAAANTAVPARLKGSAVHAVQKVPVCNYDKTGFPSAPQLATLVNQLTVLGSWFGPTAHVDWDRFPVHEWTEMSATGFTASQPVPIGPYVVAGKAAASAPGHGIADRALTEGLISLWCNAGQCLQCPNPARPPGAVPVLDDNRDWLVPDGSISLYACARGRGTTTNIDFPDWLARSAASAVNALSLTGLTWTAPAFYAGPCFARTHNHLPGYGEFLSSGWLGILRDVRTRVAGGSDLTFMMETSNAYFGQEIGMQNDWSFGVVLPGFQDPFDPVRAKALWHGLPIRSIPMFAMVANHVKLGSVYHGDSLSMPYTSIDPKSSVPHQYFDQFPAVSGALAAWSQANRTLARRGMVFVGLEGYEDLAAMTTPADDLTARAQADMVGWVRRLAMFLQGPAARPFHTGTLMKPAEISVLNQVESFSLPLLPFPRLSFWLTPLGFTDVNFATYSPVNASLQLTGREWFMPCAPEERPTWLPNGTYRADDGRIGVLVGNPMGVRHGLQASNRPLNPFTFDYATPANSPGTGYDYLFRFRPSDYPGFLGQSALYDLTVVTVNDQGTSQQTLPNLSGTLVLPAERLEPFVVRGYFLTAH